MCLKPWQGGGKDHGTGHKESGRPGWQRRMRQEEAQLGDISKVTFPALKESIN